MRSVKCLLVPSSIQYYSLSSPWPNDNWIETAVCIQTQAYMCGNVGTSLQIDTAKTTLVRTRCSLGKANPNYKLHFVNQVESNLASYRVSIIWERKFRYKEAIDITFGLPFSFFKIKIKD